MRVDYQHFFLCQDEVLLKTSPIKLLVPTLLTYRWKMKQTNKKLFFVSLLSAWVGNKNVPDSNPLNWHSSRWVQFWTHTRRVSPPLKLQLQRQSMWHRMILSLAPWASWHRPSATGWFKRPGRGWRAISSLSSLSSSDVFLDKVADKWELLHTATADSWTWPQGAFVDIQAYTIG